MAFDILIVDDEKDICELVSGILEDEGYKTRSSNSYIEALENIREKRPNLVILDVWLGDSDKDGLRLLDVIVKDYDNIPVIMMSGHGTIETAVLAIKHGAYDFIEKPFDSNRLLVSISKAIEMYRLKQENAELKIKAKVSDTLIGDSMAMSSLRQSIEKVAQLQGRCFIQGPMGSNKEEVAREIHSLSPRSSDPFFVFNCQNYLSSQIDMELFGTQIISDGEKKIKVGIFEKTNGGTLYIDEITNLSYDVQLKLRKVLKENSFSRIGSTHKIPLNIRIISGSSLDMTSFVKNGLFIDELYYRLSANIIKITPLSSRQEDIPILLDYYMKQTAKAYNIHPKKFSKDAMSILTSYYWPGDVMQLKNLVDWVMVMTSFSESKDMITLEDLPREITEGKSFGGKINTQFISLVSGLSIKEARETFEREYFLEQLRKFSGNISQTSKFVGMERSALHRKLKSLNIHDPKSSGEHEDV